MKKILDKIIDFNYNLILIFIIICFSVSLIGAVFFYVNRSFNYFNPLALIIGSIVYLFLIIKLYKYIIKLEEKTKKRICVVLLVAHFALLFISSQIIRSVPQVDLIHILTAINSLNDKGNILNTEYFSVYPNNKFLLLILYGIQKIPISHEIIFGFISSFSITIMSLFTYKSVSKISNKNNGLISLFICVFSPIFYLYVSYCYTDILMLPFASIVIYLMIKIRDNDNLKSNIIYGFLIGAISCIGYSIRAVCVFLLIAYLIYILISKKMMSFLKKLIPIMVGFIVVFTCVNIIESNFFTNLDENKEFPMTHWIMMGFNRESDGYYTQTDYELSKSADNVDERKELNINETKNRLDSLGILGTGKLMLKKLVVIWGKGDYSYQKYLGLVYDYNESYSYLVEDRNIAVNYVLQFSKISILILCIISLIKLLKNKQKSFIAISIFGAIIFYLMWEVCPRYGLSFLPWLIILSSYSFDNMSFDFSSFKIYKYLKYIIVIVTIGLFAFSFGKFVSPSMKKSIVSKDTVNKVKYIELNQDTTVTQSLKLNNKFNEIKLKFRINENTNDNSIKLELLDDNNDIKYTHEFNISDIENKKYTSLKLDKDYDEGNYFIRLNSNANIEVYISYKEEFDYYKEGILKINGKEESGDLMFEVIYNEERGIYSLAEYISMILVCLGIEYIILFKE